MFIFQLLKDNLHLHKECSLQVQHILFEKKVFQRKFEIKHQILFF